MVVLLASILGLIIALVYTYVVYLAGRAELLQYWYNEWLNWKNNRRFQ